MGQVDDDIVSNTARTETFDAVVAARLSRRSFLRGSVAAAAASVGGLGALLDAMPKPAGAQGAPLLGFQSVPVSAADTVVVPPGYTARVLIAWGDPVSDGPAFRQDASNSAAEQAQQWGMHNDGLIYFPIDGSRRGLLVQNNEYTDDILLFPDGTANWDQEKTDKALAAHGVSIVEVSRVVPFGQEGRWQVVRPSRYARRITGQTVISLGGPAAGDDRLRTSADPTGRVVLGTLNNCAMGFTPWGTRFRVAEEPNEPNRFGWVVEIDPFAPRSTPVKRTALGRLKHEGAWVQESRQGKVVVYMGDDEQFEYIYRYVSTLPWRLARQLHRSPLDEGTLYVAAFHPDGTGEWLPLTPENPKLAGWTLNDILINTRGAADLAGATPMDRPEWIDTFPDALTAVATLTNNSARGTTGTNPRTGLPNAPVDAANPRPRNTYGHIIYWTYQNDWTEPTFRWDIAALGGDPAVPEHGATVNGDKFGSPDGLYIAPSGRVWIQTDVSGSTINSGGYAGFGNNQMLCADPATREVRRFLVGPVGCEVTGAFATPDERALFVGIQHPGEAPTGANDPADPKRYSSWPDGPAGGRPRSSCLVITKDNGGPVGS